MVWVVERKVIVQAVIKDEGQISFVVRLSVNFNSKEVALRYIAMSKLSSNLTSRTLSS